MPVDFSNILHVLAHELRTPVGVAHGYVRLLLEGRLPQEADRRRALEQMQKALSRLTALSNETTGLAVWYEEDRHGGDRRDHLAGARAIIDRVASADYDSPVIVDATNVSDGMMLRTSDPNALTNALVNVVRATARELSGQPCAVSARICERRLEMLAGPSEHLGALTVGPASSAAGPLALERGGLGLSLIHAAIVLDAHGAEHWTIDGSRQTAGIRLPLEERPLP